MSIYDTVENMEYKLHELIYKAKSYEPLDEEQFQLKVLELLEQFIDELSVKPGSDKPSEPSAEQTTTVGSDATQPTESKVEPEVAPESTEAPEAAKPEVKKNSGRNTKATT